MIQQFECEKNDCLRSITHYNIVKIAYKYLTNIS